MSTRVLFGLTAVVLLVYPLGARSDEPTAKDEQMTCEQFQDKFPTQGNTEVKFSTTNPTDSMFDKQQVNPQWMCIKFNADGRNNYKVTATINSSFHRWVVIDKEKNCESVAKRVNDAVKRFEQEHIDDVKPTLDEFNKKLDDDVISKEFCGDNLNDTKNKVKSAGNNVAEHADTAFDGKAKDHDLGGKHTVNYNCSCAK